ncbi:myosin-binding protein C, fast-type-like isoform X8 [Alosa sapidissima]|uniref:myosin-binding protein C, fast-type-like isoform X8 n=1 Tax=Alosa sapidissima TaxID=34773 RepID=UPI001C0889CC|nr:myosin-binding protein C, fast-type-like isoform X8 [Alosa sapidissima]
MPEPTEAKTEEPPQEEKAEAAPAEEESAGDAPPEAPPAEGPEEDGEETAVNGEVIENGEAVPGTEGQEAPASTEGEVAPAATDAPEAPAVEEEPPVVEEPPPTLTGMFLERPEDVVAIAGTDVTFVAKVDATTLRFKPSAKWLKGKWLDLGSKAGKHLQFKETYDRNSKIYTYEMKIIKVVVADAGGYRCEVASKDKCDSTTFEVSVEAADTGDHQHDVLSAFKREGAGEDDGELDFSSLLKAVKKKKKKPVEEEKEDVWEILKKAHPSEYEKIAFDYGITDLRGMLKRLKKMKTVVPKISDAFIKKLEDCYSVEKGKKIVLTCEVVDPNCQVKWLKNGQEIKPSAKYIMEANGNLRTLTINKCSLADDAAYECVCGTDKSYTEVFVKEPPITITKLMDDYHVTVGERVEFEVEVSEEGAHVMWYFENLELVRTEDSKFRFKKDGKRHWLIIQEATLNDIGMYHCFTNGGHTKGELEVEEKELEVLQDMADLTVKSAEQAMFKCEVSDDKVTGKWFKDGVEVLPSDRIKMSHIGRFHRLTIDDVKPEDAGDYTFVPDGHALSLSAKLNFLEIKVDYVPRQEPPKIHLDVTGQMVSQNTIIVVAGNKLRLDTEISGDPPPTVQWMRGDKVIGTEAGRVRVESRTGLSSFVIEGAEREDEGNYSITVTNPAGEDKANIHIKIVDVPDPPENVKCTAVGEDCATITWEAPKIDGGAPIKGYYMERKKKGSSRWTKLNFDVYESTTYEAKRMIEGVLYEMRVFAVNSIGMSQPSLNSKPFMPIAPTSEPTRLMVNDVTDTTCSLKWLAPERIGAGGLDGYIIEYCKEGDTEWQVANSEPVDRQSFVVRNLPTGEKLNFRVVAVNIAGRSPPALLGQPVTIREIVERPKIRLPRSLRQKYVRQVGDQINLVIPFQGKPRPVATWLKDGEPVDLKKVGVRNSFVDSVLFIRSAERDHSGKYTLVLQIENMEDRATIDIRVVEKPGPPTAVKVTDIWGFNAALEWKPPKDDGNCEITGYLIQKADKKTMEWFTVYEHNRRTNCTASDLVMGNEYMFRVFSVNMCGPSDDPGVSKDTAKIVKQNLEYKPPPFKEHDMNCPPKFTAPLVDRSVIQGYSAAMSCAVKASPRPKIIWLKNNMILGDDPKYLMMNNQGVLTLNIRKPGMFDGGKYTCRAVNDLGQAEVECKLEIRPQPPMEEKRK